MCQFSDIKYGYVQKEKERLWNGSFKEKFHKNRERDFLKFASVLKTQLFLANKTCFWKHVLHIISYERFGKIAIYNVRAQKTKETGILIYCQILHLNHAENKISNNYADNRGDKYYISSGASEIKKIYTMICGQETRGYKMKVIW